MSGCKIPTHEIVFQSHEALKVGIEVDADLIYFQGHFNQKPVLAGVVQLHWVCHFARLMANRLILTGASVLKFQKPVLPTMQLDLNIQFDKDKSVIIFSYQHETITYSSGKLNVRLS